MEGGGGERRGRGIGVRKRRQNPYIITMKIIFYK